MLAVLDLPPPDIAQAAIRNNALIEDRNICILQPSGQVEQILRWYTGSSNATQTELETKVEVLENHLRYLGCTGLNIPQRYGHYIERDPDNEERLAIYTHLEFIHGRVLEGLEYTEPHYFVQYGDLVLDALRQYRAWTKHEILYDIVHAGQYTLGYSRKDDHSDLPRVYMHDTEPIMGTVQGRGGIRFDDEITELESTVASVRAMTLQVT